MALGGARQRELGDRLALGIAVALALFLGGLAVFRSSEPHSQTRSDDRCDPRPVAFERDGSASIAPRNDLRETIVHATRRLTGRITNRRGRSGILRTSPLRCRESQCRHHRRVQRRREVHAAQDPHRIPNVAGREIRGRVRNLEVGTGFNQELTGREKRVPSASFREWRRSGTRSRGP